MAETTSYYNCICTIYKYRLLFPTDKEYTQAWGNEFSTVRANKGNEAKIYSYYQILNNHWKECDEDWDLITLVDSFQKASKLYHTIDWGTRRQMASRKKFMRMCFRILTSGDPNFYLPPDEWHKFNHQINKKDDKRIFQALVSKEDNRSPQLELWFIFLFTFGIISPIESKYMDSLDFSKKRGQDITENDRIKASAKFIEMIKVFRDDIKHTSCLGYAPLQQLISTLHRISSDVGIYPFLFYPCLLDMIHSFVIGKGSRYIERSFDKFSFLNFSGIWIDASYKGIENTEEERFWIFSKPYCLFCYRGYGVEWRVDSFMLLGDSDTLSDNSISSILCESDEIFKYLIQPGNINFFNSYKSFDIHWECNKEGVNLIKFCISPDLTSSENLVFKRLDKSNPQYNHFKTTLKNIYSHGTVQNLYFENPHIPLLYNINCYIGMDNKYLYVSDLPKPTKWIIKEEDDETFSYEPEDYSYEPQLSLLDIKISEDHPLYLIPRKGSRKSYTSKDLYNFMKRLESIESIDEAIIFHIETKDKNLSTRKSFLFIPFIYSALELDDDTIKELGIIKITKPFIIR